MYVLVYIQDEKRAALKVVMESTLTKTRKRSLGNIRFIGELFKLQMLSETIMHECITHLLKSSSDEESLECFSRLITTTGKDLDRELAKVDLMELVRIVGLKGVHYFWQYDYVTLLLLKYFFCRCVLIPILSASMTSSRKERFPPESALCYKM